MGNDVKCSWAKGSQMGFSRAQFWGQSCLISSSALWRKESSASSVRSQEGPVCVGVLLHVRAEGSAKGSGHTGSMGQGQLCDVQQGQVLGPTLVSQQLC